MDSPKGYIEERTAIAELLHRVGFEVLISKGKEKEQIFPYRCLTADVCPIILVLYIYIYVICHNIITYITM